MNTYKSSAQYKILYFTLKAWQGIDIENDLKKKNNLSSDFCCQTAGRLVMVRYFSIVISNESKFL